MSSFQIGPTTATFTAVGEINDDAGPLEEVSFGVLLDNSTLWGALFSLRSWSVTARPIPGGNNVYVDIGGGAGAGTLIVDNLWTHTAVLTKLSARELEPGTLRYVAMATFLITA